MAIRRRGEGDGSSTSMSADSSSSSVVDDDDEHDNDRKCNIVPLSGHAHAVESHDVVDDIDVDDPKCSSSRTSLLLPPPPPAFVVVVVGAMRIRGSRKSSPRNSIADADRAGPGERKVSTIPTPDDDGGGGEEEERMEEEEDG